MLLVDDEVSKYRLMQKASSSEDTEFYKIIKQTNI